MSLVPVFRIEVWNAWILMALLFFFIMLSGLLPKDIGKRITPAKETKKTRNMMLIVFFTLMIYSVFLPLERGTVWFYVGLSVYILGLIVSAAALFSIGATKPGDPFTKGMYRYSRHPISLGTILCVIGVGIASASWLFLLLSVLLMVVSHILAISEENATADKFGSVYNEYTAQTPRWIGLPKSSNK
jgi:protein-S-isoprenylcysteine O-methyltransferase Ste14